MSDTMSEICGWAVLIVIALSITWMIIVANTGYRN